MELLNSKHILSNELVQKMGIHIANISMIDSPNIVKMGNCNFLCADDLYLPKNIKKFILQNEFTNLENSLPVNYVKAELGVSEKQLFDSKIVSSVQEIAGKKFYKFTDDFISRIHKKVLYILDKEDWSDCLRDKQITDYVKLNNNKYLTMY